MGLDLALGGLLLLNGIRGWFKGFILQAVRLVGLVACVYVADPVRDVVKPRVIGQLPSIRPDLVDRMLWWTAAGVSYFVMVGVATLLVKFSRRKTLGEPEPNYNDQFAGLLLGLIKGVVITAFVVAGVEKYALGYLKSFPWAEQQASASRALAWNEKYRPVPRVWASPPVQHFVNQIQRKGILPPEEARSDGEPVAAANRAPQLAIPLPEGTGIDPEVDRLVESIRAEIRKLEQPH